MTREARINEALALALFGWVRQSATGITGEIVWWERRSPCPDGSPFEYTVVKQTCHIPDYCTTWEGMRMVVEGMGKQEYMTDMVHRPDGKASARMQSPRLVTGEWVNAPTAPMAASLAALAALGQEVPE